MDNTSGGTNNSGILSADVASRINLNNQTITGGTLNGGGTFTGGGNFNNGVSVTGTLDLTGSSLTTTGGLTLNGQANITNNQGLYLNGDQTIGGTSTLSLGTLASGSTASTVGNLLIYGTATVVPTITVDALNGSLQGYAYGGTLVNQGTLQASGAGRSLSISTGLVNNGAIVANGAGSTVTVSSSTTGNGTVSTGTGGTVTFSGGSAIQQAAGTSQIDGNVNLGSGSTFTVAGGTLKGTGTVTGNVVSNGGTVAPGDSPGTLTVNGNFTQNSPAALEIEFANTAHDTLVVSGNAALNQGLLNVSFLGTTVNSSSFSTFSFLSYGGTLSGSTTSDPLMLFSNEFKSATYDSSYGITNGHYVNGPAGPYSSGSIYLLTQNTGSLLITPKQISPAAAPEPSQYAAFAIGLLGLGALALKARKRATAA